MNEFQLLTCSNLHPSDIVETICVSSSSWHCNTLYTCFFDWNCEHDNQKECYMKSKEGNEIINKNCCTKFMKCLCSILGMSLLQRKRNEIIIEQCCNQPTISNMTNSEDCAGLHMSIEWRRTVFQKKTLLEG